MITNKKIVEKLDLLEKNFKKEIDSLRVDNETRFNELDKRTKLQEDISNLKLKLKDNDSIIEKYANKINNLESENKTLKLRNEELESSSYLRVELEPDKPQPQKMSMKASKIKSCKTTVNKQLKEISENNLKKENKIGRIKFK